MLVGEDAESLLTGAAGVDAAAAAAALSSVAPDFDTIGDLSFFDERLTLFSPPNSGKSNVNQVRSSEVNGGVGDTRASSWQCKEHSAHTQPTTHLCCSTSSCALSWESTTWRAGHARKAENSGGDVHPTTRRPVSRGRRRKTQGRAGQTTTAETTPDWQKKERKKDCSGIEDQS